MKAIVRTQYGPPDVLQFTEVEKPTPKDNEVLIKLYAASVNPLDLFSLRGAPLIRLIPGLRTPKCQVLGCDIAGRVEAIGGHVKQFHPGDEVFGVTGFAGGGFAEYVCAIEANRSGLRSLPCAARGMWTRRDRLAPTMSLITRGKISGKVGSVTT